MRLTAALCSFVLGDPRDNTVLARLLPQLPYADVERFSLAVT